MIIQCGSCSRKFIVKDNDIPKKGRVVQCGYCFVTWHQNPVTILKKTIKKKNKPATVFKESLSVDKIKASDGKTYKFLGTQWAQLFPSGKTGLFAKREIGKELDKLTGRKERIAIPKKQKKIKEVDPSSEDLSNAKKLPDVYRPKEGFGFFGYLFLIIIITVSLVGVLKTFENDLISYFPETMYIFDLLNGQIEYFSETIRNMIVIINDLMDSY